MRSRERPLENLRRANLSDPREDIDDSEVGLTYQTHAKPELREKWRETLRKLWKANLLDPREDLDDSEVGLTY